MGSITQDVEKGRLHSAYSIGPFDKAKEALESEGYRVISLEEQAGLRMQEGANSSISQRGNWAREGFIYVPKKGDFLSKKSPIMANAKKAIDCHRNGKDFYLNDEQVEEALADSVKISETQIPTSDFAEREITRYAFGKNAKAYGEFLKENRIGNLTIYLADSQDNPFTRQAWLRRVGGGGRSILSGNNGNFNDDNGEVRGVHDAKVDTQKILAYTPEQIKDALKKANLSEIEQILFDNLR